MRADQPAARQILGERPQLIGEPGLLNDATSSGRRQAVELLLRLGAEVNALAADGATAPDQLAWRGNRELAQVLIAAGAQPVRDRTHDSMPTGWGDYAGNESLRDYLLNECADALELVATGMTDRVELLMAAEPAAVEQRDAAGNGVLHYLRESAPDLQRMLTALFAAGADPGASNQRGHTTLVHAQARGADRVAAAL